MLAEPACCALMCSMLAETSCCALLYVSCSLFCCAVVRNTTSLWAVAPPPAFAVLCCTVLVCALLLPPPMLRPPLLRCMQARDYFERQQPPEKRIIEYLVSIPDPTERSRLLDQALTPGPTRYTGIQAGHSSSSRDACVMMPTGPALIQATPSSVMTHDL